MTSATSAASASAPEAGAGGIPAAAPRAWEDDRAAGSAAARRPDPADDEPSALPAAPTARGDDEAAGSGAAPRPARPGEEQRAAQAAAGALAQRSGLARHDVAVVLGSGWAAAADALGEPLWEAPVGELPGFPSPTALGHGGTVRSVRRGDLTVLVLLGRAHLYEGHPAATITHGVRTAVAAGCRTVVLTNAAGGIRPGLTVGQPVLVADHLDLTARVAGAPGGAAGPDRPRRGSTGWPGSPYASTLRELARRHDPSLVDGVYAGLAGPQFETPAEIRALRVLGADLVGMSTVHEAAAAHAAGADVLGVSLVSNLAAGVSPTPLDAHEVLDAGRAALPRLAALLSAVLDRLPAAPGRAGGTPGSAAAR